MLIAFVTGKTQEPNTKYKTAFLSVFIWLIDKLVDKAIKNDYSTEILSHKGKKTERVE